MKRHFVLLSCLLISLGAFGDEWDALLSRNGKAEKKVQTFASIKDPFLQQLYAEVLTQSRITVAERDWADLVLREQYEEALKEFSNITFKPSFKPVAEAAMTYGLWKLGLGQTFVNNWISNSIGKREKSRLWVILDSQIRPNFDSWIKEAPITLSAQQMKLLLDQKEIENPVILTLTALASLRTGKRMDELVRMIPADHPYKLALAQKLGYENVKKGDVKSAAKIFKSFWEPAARHLAEEADKPEVLADYYLNIARLLYQGGQFEASIKYFDLIPNGAPQFVQAREEVIWPLLMTKNFKRLRGELETLKQPIFTNRYSPETFVVRALTNLHFCFYTEVQKDIRSFMDINESWAKKIDESLAQKFPPLPIQPDFYSQWATQTVKALTREYGRLAEIGVESKKNSYWDKQLKKLSEAQKEARALQRDEYARQWSNDKKVLSEAIRKMKFIRIEYLSETRLLNTKSEKWKKNLLAARAHSDEAGDVASDSGQMVFKYDGTVWADELFNLRSQTPARCSSLLEGVQ